MADWVFSGKSATLKTRTSEVFVEVELTSQGPQLYISCEDDRTCAHGSMCSAEIPLWVINKLVECADALQQQRRKPEKKYYEDYDEDGGWAGEIAL